MKNYSINYHFGQMDKTPRNAWMSVDAGFSVEQVASMPGVERLSVDQAVRAANTAFEAIRPPGDPSAPTIKGPGGEAWTALLESQGRMKAAQLLSDISEADDQLPVHARNRAPFIKKGLGHLAERIGKGKARLVRGTADDMRRAAGEMESQERASKKGTKK